MASELMRERLKLPSQSSVIVVMRREFEGQLEIVVFPVNPFEFFACPCEALFDGSDKYVDCVTRHFCFNCNCLLSDFCLLK